MPAATGAAAALSSPRHQLLELGARRLADHVPAQLAVVIVDEERRDRADPARIDGGDQLVGVVELRDVGRQVGRLLLQQRADARPAPARSGSSSESDSTSRPRGFISRANLSMSGSSSRQGPHQLAQKCSSTTWPRPWRSSPLIASMSTIRNGADAFPPGAGAPARWTGLGRRRRRTRHRRGKQPEREQREHRWRTADRGRVARAAHGSSLPPPAVAAPIGGRHVVAARDQHLERRLRASCPARRHRLDRHEEQPPRGRVGRRRHEDAAGVGIAVDRLAAAERPACACARSRRGPAPRARRSPRGRRW